LMTHLGGTPSVTGCAIRMGHTMGRASLSWTGKKHG
jgi:hypothetical protein